MREAWQWIKSNHRDVQRGLGFTQVTLSQVALWDFIPVNVALGMSAVAGLLQVWNTFLNRPEQKA